MKYYETGDFGEHRIESEMKDDDNHIFYNTNNPQSADVYDQDSRVPITVVGTSSILCCLLNLFAQWKLFKEVRFNNIKLSFTKQLISTAATVFITNIAFDCM